MSNLVVLITIDGKRAAIAAPDVESVIELEAIYPVPGTPDYVAGLAAMRSQTMTVIDCNAALGLHSASQYAERCPVISVGGHLYALLVDTVEDVIEATSQPSDIAGGYGAAWAPIAKGMIETDTGPALLIDPTALVLKTVVKAA